MSDHDESPGRDGAHGQRVSLADGTEVVLATWFSRAVARALGSAVVAAVVLVSGGVGFMLGLSRAFSGSHAAWFAGSFGAAGFVLSAALEVLRVVKTGQTIGMATAGIRVVSLGAGDVSLGRSALRWLVPVAVAVCGCMLAGLVFFPDEAVSELFFGSIFYVPWFGLPAVWLLLFVVALRRSDRRSWHDRVARTIVVIAESSTKRR